MIKLLPFLLLFGSACFLAYLKEIDRLERDQEPRQVGKRFVAVGVASLVLTFLFTLISADAGLILLTLTLYLATALAGIAAGSAIALTVYRRRNPDLFEEE